MKPTNLTGRFYNRLPVRRLAADKQLHLLNGDERQRLRRVERTVMLVAAIFSVLGFLAYYLPIYYYPSLFPSVSLTTLSFGSAPLKIAWGELVWGVILSMLELWALVFLHITGVHEIAVATGFLNADNKVEKGDAVMRVGLEKRSKELSQYGIDPFQGLSKWLLFLFNIVLRLKGWIGNQLVRYLTRLLLGRYAVRSVLDFVGMPIYMAINAYSVHTVMREARVIFMGHTVVALLAERLPPAELSPSEKELLYDTLQYIAISKRDFHQNHYLLARALLEHFGIPRKEYHRLPDDYLDKLWGAPSGARALCQLVILLGFILDGRLSWRERLKLRRLSERGILSESDAQVKRCLKDFLDGVGVDGWSEEYLSRFAGTARQNAVS